MANYRYGFLNDGLCTAWGKAIYETVHARGQYRSADELQHRQDRAVQRMVEHAYHSVPHYRRAFSAAGYKPGDVRSAADLARLPVLKKAAARQLGADLRSDKWLRRPTLQATTSGSSGSPMGLWQNYYQVAFDFASIWMVFKWAGYRFRDSMVTVRSYVPKQDGPLWYGDKLRGFYFFSAYHMEDDNLRLYTAKMLELKPKFLRGYPHSLHILARYCLRHGIDGIRPQAALTCSEQLTPIQRKDIEEAFNTRVFDRYGNIEMVAHAGECERHEGYHIDPFYGVIELLNDQGKPVAPGTPGRLVATGLTNYAMPLIRYEIGDMAIGSGRACSCGRAMPLLQSIEGRLDDVLHTPSGRQIPPVNFYTMFQAFPNVDFFRLEQRQVDTLAVYLVADDFGSQDETRLRAELSRRIGADVHLDIRRVAQLDKGAFGKFRCIRSYVNVTPS